VFDNAENKQLLPVPSATTICVTSVCNLMMHSAATLANEIALGYMPCKAGKFTPTYPERARHLH